VLDGRSFLPVLTGTARTHKTHVFGLQTTRGINNGSPYYGIRSVRDARYRYVRNLTPEVAFENAATADPTFKTWEKMAAAGDAVAQRLVRDYRHRPAEELFDCETDPWNRANLIADPKLAAVRDELRAQLAAWMQRQGDEGQPTEMNALARMPNRGGGADGEGAAKKKKKKA